MGIKLSQTFEIVTEESAADGEAADRGFDWQDVDYGFRETVDLIRNEGFSVPSCVPGVPGWLSTEVIQDRAYFEDGEHRTLSLHPGRDARSRRYWAKACRAAGMLKDAEHWRALIKDAHYRGLRAEVTYKRADGDTAKGLAVQDATKGVGPAGVWFVCVGNFAERVALSAVVSVRQVER